MIEMDGNNGQRQRLMAMEITMEEWMETAIDSNRNGGEQADGNNDGRQ